MNILVTGGAGFIGSHFIKHILCEHPTYKVLNVDKLTYAGTMRNVEGIDLSNFTNINCDMANSAVGKLMKEYKINTVVNFAAGTHVDRSINDPLSFTNMDSIVVNLVRFAQEVKVSRFVHISTDEVYGPIPVGLEASIDAPLHPTSPYSVSKAAIDLLLLSYHKTYGFPAIIVRPCNNYGPNQYPEKLIPMSINRLLEGKKVLLHGEGDEVREFIYVKDTCRAIDILVHEGELGKVYNVGSGHRLNNRETIAVIIRKVKGESARFGPEYVEKIPNRPGNDSRYAIRCDWKPSFHRTPFDKGISKTVEWYKNNTTGWWPNIDLEANIYKKEVV